MKKWVSGGPRSAAQNGPKNLDFSWQKIWFSEQTGFQKMNPKITKTLKNVHPGGHRFGPQNGPQNVGFSLQKKVFGANGVPKNDSEKV